MILLLLLLPRALCNGGDAVALHTFTMFQLSHFPDSNVVRFLGNATLDGMLTHSLESNGTYLSAHQLLHPLEAPQVWKHRKDSLQTYLRQFWTMVEIVVKETRIKCYAMSLAYRPPGSAPRPAGLTAPVPFQHQNPPAAPDPLHVSCTLGCQLLLNDTSHGFYEVELDGEAILTFHAANASWVTCEDSVLATYTCTQLNQYRETTTKMQHFLQKTCVEFVRQYSKAQNSRMGRQQGRSHAPLALGIALGAFALAGLAIGIFVYTGGYRR
uniref:MHC class I-like antigen recognition-like domain-containing protein n=1 Tax=Sphenodon punctatus TaxID=8508 RepID=A0A8D0HRI9_SPHPU